MKGRKINRKDYRKKKKIETLNMLERKKKNYIERFHFHTYIYI